MGFISIAKPSVLKTQTRNLLLFGLVWLALGYVLWSRREVVTEQPLRVR